MLRCTMNKNNGITNRGVFIRTLSMIFKASPWLLALVLISEFMIGLIQTGTLVAWQYAVNAVGRFINERSSYISLFFVLTISLLSYVIMDLFRMVLESLYTLLNNHLSESFHSKLYDKCKVISSIHFENSELYNEIDRADDSIDNIVSIVGIIGIFVMAASRILTLGTYIFFEEPIFVLVVVLPIVPIALARIIRGKSLYRFDYEQSERRRECSYYQKCILNKETKTLQAVPYFSSKWDNLYRKVSAEEREVNRKLCLLFLLLNMLKYSVYIVAIVLAAFRLFEGFIDIGTFALITSMLDTAHATIEVVVSRSGDIGASMRYAKDYFFFMDKPDDIKSEKMTVRHSLNLKGVSFSYPNSDKNVLDNINLSIKHGEKLAFVGMNGAGKTTLAKIILGHYNPTQGEILVDGNPRFDNMLIDSSAVFQDFCKYFFTLRENVAFGDIGSIGDDVKLLGMLDTFSFDVSKTLESLDTQLGREFDGVELSGGEWQKIALARGFSKAADFIVLDEPNSGLDPIAENRLFRCFMELLKDSTGIIITHRIGIASLADRIVLLDNGRISEEGTHEELMDKHGKYYAMFEAQANIYR